MKRKVLFVLLLLLTTALGAQAQVSYFTVTGTIQDPNSRPYASANYAFVLVDIQGIPISSATTPNGSIFNALSVRGKMSSTGFFSVQLVPNNILTGPQGRTQTFWKLTIGPPTDSWIINYTNSWTINYTFSLTGTLDLSTAVNALAQPISFANLLTNQSTFGSGGGVLPSLVANPLCYYATPGSICSPSAGSGIYTPSSGPPQFYAQNTTFLQPKVDVKHYAFGTTRPIYNFTLGGNTSCTSGTPVGTVSAPVLPGIGVQATVTLACVNNVVIVTESFGGAGYDNTATVSISGAGTSGITATPGFGTYTANAADPSQVLDSSSAIQQAINFVSLAYPPISGGPFPCIYLSPGNYNIGTTLRIPSIVHICGDGQNTVNLFATQPTVGVATVYVNNWGTPGGTSGFTVGGGMTGITFASDLRPTRGSPLLGSGYTGTFLEIDAAHYSISDLSFVNGCGRGIQVYSSGEELRGDNLNFNAVAWPIDGFGQANGGLKNIFSSVAGACLSSDNFYYSVDAGSVNGQWYSQSWTATSTTILSATADGAGNATFQVQCFPISTCYNNGVLGTSSPITVGQFFRISGITDPSYLALNGDFRATAVSGTPCSGAGCTGTGITAVSIGSPACGTCTYAVGDLLNLAGGTRGVVQVTAVSSGTPTAISITSTGTGYGLASNVATTGGSGSGATINITAIGGSYFTITTTAGTYADSGTQSGGNVDYGNDQTTIFRNRTLNTPAAGSPASLATASFQIDHSTPQNAAYTVGAPGGALETFRCSTSWHLGACVNDYGGGTYTIANGYVEFFSQGGSPGTTASTALPGYQPHTAMTASFSQTGCTATLPCSVTVVSDEWMRPHLGDITHTGQIPGSVNSLEIMPQDFCPQCVGIPSAYNAAVNRNQEEVVSVTFSNNTAYITARNVSGSTAPSNTTWPSGSLIGQGPVQPPGGEFHVTDIHSSGIVQGSQNFAVLADPASPMISGDDIVGTQYDGYTQVPFPQTGATLGSINVTYGDVMGSPCGATNLQQGQGCVVATEGMLTFLDSYGQVPDGIPPVPGTTAGFLPTAFNQGLISAIFPEALSGTANTTNVANSVVTSVSGNGFPCLAAGDNITVNSVVYQVVSVAASVNNPGVITINGNPGTLSGTNYSFTGLCAARVKATSAARRASYAYNSASYSRTQGTFSGDLTSYVNTVAGSALSPIPGLSGFAGDNFVNGIARSDVGGYPVVANITSWIRSGEVVTFLATNSFAQGKCVVIQNLVAGALYNSYKGVQCLTIVAPVSSSEFSVNYSAYLPTLPAAAPTIGTESTATATLYHAAFILYSTGGPSFTGTGVCPLNLSYNGGTTGGSLFPAFQMCSQGGSAGLGYTLFSGTNALIFGGAFPNSGADTGAVNALALTLAASPGPLTDGERVFILPANNNTTTTPTLNVNAIGAKTITKNGEAALVSGDLSTDTWAELTYHAATTHWQLQNPHVAAGNGIFLGTTGSIGGSALSLGCTNQATVTVTGATTSMVCDMSGVAGNPTNIMPQCSVTSANTVTPQLCTAVAGTPTAQTYNIRVIP